MYETVLVPTDGSEHAIRAVEHALDLAASDGAIVHALYVVDTHRYGEPALSSAEIVLEELEAEGRDLLADVAGRAAERHVTVEQRLRRGAPADEILAHADEIDADVVVIGYRGRSHRKRIGSVTDRVVRRTNRPVLAV